MAEAKTSRHVAARSDKGPRKSNQDCAFAGSLKNANGTDVWAVCVADGVGGGQHGEQAATLAVNSLCSLVRDSAFSDVTALKALIPKWIAGLNDAVKEIAGGDDSVNTTLSACLISDGRSLIVHVGDSRLYVVDEKSCRPVTVDHNDANEALKQGVDEEFVGKTDFRALSRCLGSGIEEVEPDIHMGFLTPGQSCWIVATSDGVHDKVPSATMLQLARAAQSAEELASDLVEWALKSGTRDNATAAILRIGKIMPTGRKPVFDSASLGKTIGVRNGSEREEGSDTPTGRRVSNGALIAVAVLLICIAAPLLWHAFFVLGKGGPGGLHIVETLIADVPGEISPVGMRPDPSPDAAAGSLNDSGKYQDAVNAGISVHDAPRTVGSDQEVKGPEVARKPETVSDGPGANPRQDAERTAPVEQPTPNRDDAIRLAAADLIDVTVTGDTWTEMNNAAKQEFSKKGVGASLDLNTFLELLPDDVRRRKLDNKGTAPIVLPGDRFVVSAERKTGKVTGITRALE